MGGAQQPGQFDHPGAVLTVERAGTAAAVPDVAGTALADRCGLAAVLVERLRITAKGVANATTKVLALVAGMACGADSIDDMDLLRHGGMGRLFADVRAPSTLAPISMQRIRPRPGRRR